MNTPVPQITAVALVLLFALALRQPALSHWRRPATGFLDGSVLAAVFAIEQLVGTITIVGASRFTEPGGPMNLCVGGTLLIVFFLALGWACGMPPNQTMAAVQSTTGKNESPSSGVPST